MQEIESAIVRLSPAERETVRDWLNDLAEAQSEVSDAFKEKITRAREELARGDVSRIRQTPAASQCARRRRFTRVISTRTSCSYQLT